MQAVLIVFSNVFECFVEDGVIETDGWEEATSEGIVKFILTAKYKATLDSVVVIVVFVI